MLARDLMLTQRRVVGTAGGNGYPGRDIARILDLYRTGRLKLDELVGRSFDLTDVGDAMDEAERADYARTILRVSPKLL